MNKNLVENNFLVIRNFISQHKAIELYKEFKDFSEKNNIDGDGQVPTSNSFYNYISFLELLCEKTPEISKTLEETVLPTYAYSRIYKNGSVLTPHTDRDACEISVTLHLGGDYPWPIYIKDPSGKNLEINLNPGDAMIYLGSDAMHWRDSFGGFEYAQVFLHYVKSRGDKSYAYFDKNREQPEKEIQKEIKKESPIIETKTPTVIVPKPNSSLEKFIHLFDDVMSEDLCDRILKEYSNCPDWSNTAVGGSVDQPTTNNELRNCQVIPISSTINSDIRSQIDEEIFEVVGKISKKYQELHPECHVVTDSGYDLLKYDEGQFYVQHTDSFFQSPRSLSCSILINDEYEGGQFAFFDREMMITGKKGSCIVFPSNFMFPHEIMPVTKGTRYSIITWLT